MCYRRINIIIIIIIFVVMLVCFGDDRFSFVTNFNIYDLSLFWVTLDKHKMFGCQ